MEVEASDPREAMSSKFTGSLHVPDDASQAFDEVCASVAHAAVLAYQAGWPALLRPALTHTAIGSLTSGPGPCFQWFQSQGGAHTDIDFPSRDTTGAVRGAVASADIPVRAPSSDESGSTRRAQHIHLP